MSRRTGRSVAGIFITAAAAGLVALMLATAAAAQTNPAPPAPAAPPVESAPLAPPPAAAAPALLPPGLPTLVPGQGDPVNVDDVMLPGRPVAVRQGSSTWDEGFRSLIDSFRAVIAELDKAGIKPSGRPLAVFVETDDQGFRYQAMIPIEAAPEGKSTLTPDILFGATPSGKALRFSHKAPYDEIDNTYEAITAYLDAKGITAQDAFIEEYVTDPKDSSDPDLEINVFVQPK